MNYQKWILIAIGLFVIGIVLGLTAPAILSDFLAGDVAALSELAETLGPFKITTAIFIFLKNTSALLFSFIFSPLLCLLPILALTANGLILSFVSAAVVQKESIGLLLAGLLPHGVLEIPALIMGEAAALSFGTLAITALIARGKRERLKPNLKENLRYLLVACALLLPAAIIETYVTPLLMSG